MKYRKTGKFKLGFLTLLLSVLFVACGSGASDADRQIKSKTDLKGAVIGVQLGTTSDGLATELEKEGGGTKVERYNKGADAIQALLQGKIDCMVTDEAPAKAFQRVNPSLRILPETFDASSFAICVAKDHAELQQSINHAIRILKENGVIDSIVNRHLERGIAVAYTPKTSDVKKVGPEALQKLGLKTSLRFATNATFEPFEYYQNGKIVGIDVDVANAIGDVNGKFAVPPLVRRFLAKTASRSADTLPRNNGRSRGAPTGKLSFGRRLRGVFRHVSSPSCTGRRLSAQEIAAYFSASSP